MLGGVGVISCALFLRGYQIDVGINLFDIPKDSLSNLNAGSCERANIHCGFSSAA